MKQFFRCSFFLIAAAFAWNHSKASHMMGADIWYTYVGPNQYEITLTFYKDCTGFVTMGPTLTISGSSASCGINLGSIVLTATVMDNEVSPLCPAQLSQSTCNNGSLPGVLQYVYKGIITLPSQCNDWLIYYEDCCRNSAITNIPTPDSYGWRVECRIDNTNGLVNSSPSFTSLPVPYVCVNQPYFYNHGGYDLDGDSLVYTLINPMDWLSAAPIQYFAPFVPTYPLSTTSGAVGFDPSSGQMSFTANATQVTVVAVRVDEYRGGQLVGYSMRDIQVVVMNCTNNPPVISGNPTNVQGGFATGPTTFEVCPGQPLSFQFVISDPDAGDSIFVTTNLATVLPGASLVTTGVNPITAIFNWQPSGIDTGFHSFTLTLKDNYCPISGQNVFSYQIFVLSGTSAGADITLCGNQTAQLQATGGNNFNWSPPTALSCTNCPDPIATPTVTTTYTVTSNLQSGCNNVDEVVVFYVPDFTFTASTGDTICVGQTLPLSSSANGPGAPFSYQWTPAAGLSAANIANPVASPTATTTYTLKITSVDGCQKTATVPVIIAGSTPQYTLDPVSPACVGSPIQLQASVGGSTANCTPTYGYGCGVADQIDLFTFNTLYHFDNVCNGYYNYFPSTTGFTTTVNAGSTYPISMQSNPSWGQGFRVWIDYNHDGDFDDPGESVYSSPNSGTMLFTGNVTIPITATPGPTRLRVMCQYAGVPGLNDYCTNGGIYYGEAQDYDIFINGPLGTSAITYEWTPAASLNDPTIPNPIATPQQSTTYTVTVSYNGFCPKTDSIAVTVIPASSNLLGDTSICVGNGVTLSPMISIPNFTWSSSPGGYVNSVDQSPTVSPTITTTYFYSGQGLAGCMSDSFVVNVSSVPPVGLLPAQDTVVCFGQSIVLQVTGDYDTFTWTPDNTLSNSSLSAVTASPDVTTTYVVEVSNAFGCESADTIVVAVLPFVLPQTIADTSICPGTPAVLSMMEDYATYSWSPAAQVDQPTMKTTLAHPATTTTYTASVTNMLGCPGTDTMVVTVFDQNNATFTTPVINILPGESVTLEPTLVGGIGYTWQSLTGFSSYNSVVTVQPVVSDVYTVTVVDYNNCVSTASVQVNVLPACLGILVPNAFSPNGDGLNDRLEMHIRGLDEFRSLTIYNRWGEKVFQTNMFTDNWDGTIKGEPAPIGTYVYKAVVYCDGVETLNSGSVTLLR